MTPEQLVAACRVPESLSGRRCGPWYIVGFPVGAVPADIRARLEIDGCDRFTALFRWTDATLHRDAGEVVMEDTPRELKRHLPVLIPARGRVLISGLGLGCVVRGLLAKPEVEHVDVIEIDPSIAWMVWPEFEGNPRATLHLGDALTHDWPAGARWDYGWHDVWCEEGSLHELHFRILARYRDRCRRQGAWMLDPTLKRIWPGPLLGARRRRAA